MSSLARGLQFLKETVYRGPLRSLARIIGVEPRLQEGYKKAISLTQSETITHKVGGVSAEFYRTDHMPSTLPEQSVAEGLISDISPDDVFYDLGANRGLYTCLAGKVIESGEIHAFEPNPIAASDLQKNIQQNDLSSTVTVHQKAVSNTAGEVPFLVRPESTGNTLQTTIVEDDAETITVKSVSLDDFIVENGIPNPTIMKIDIEGAELDALKSMKKSLQDCRLIYCEVHENMFDEFVLPAEILRERGFNEINRIYDRSDSHYILRASKTGN